MLIDVHTEGETVLIKAIVTKVHLDKDRVTYSLKDAINNVPYQNRFSEKDILPYNGTADEEATEEESDGKLGS